MNEQEIALLKTASIRNIAFTISEDWGTHTHYSAKPYIDAMLTMEKITDPYYLDSGVEIVARFLCNAGTWRGETARIVKKELNARLKNAYKKGG